VKRPGLRSPLRNTTRSTIGRSGGQAVLEFALIVPVMLLMLLLAVDFGRVFFSYVQVTNAAREAANYAAAHAVDYQSGTFTYTQFHDGSINAALQEANVQTQAGATAPMAISSPTCFTPQPTMVSCADAPETPTTASGTGAVVSVTVTQPFTFFMPIIGDFFGGTLNLSATATATVLNPLVAQVVSPSASPGGSPGASPTPSPSPTPAPSATPAPTPTPAPVNCTVPDYKHTYWNDVGGSTATKVWQNAGFTGNLSGSTAVVQGAKIQNQTLAAGQLKPCASSMTVS
jgi:Flp pilus assembly protein TadG